MKTESLSFDIAAIIKREEPKQSTGIYCTHNILKAKTQLKVYYQRTESIFNSSGRTCFKI